MPLGLAAGRVAIHLAGQGLAGIGLSGSGAQAGARGGEGVIALEVDGRHDAGPAQPVADGGLEVVVDQALVLELDLLLGGVHVDVNARRVDLQKNDVEGVGVLTQQLVVGHGDRVVQVARLDVAVVDEKELPHLGLTGRLGLADVAADAENIGSLLDGHEQVAVLLTEYGDDALAQFTGGQA